ncbi:MAG TPA: protein translocase subunit SecD [Verrucomicrobiae bacterium]|jgi:SecD/SecF fusion protein
MKQNNLGRFILVICIVAWALFEVYPPTSRDLVQEFNNRAQAKDAVFTSIMAEVATLQKAGTNGSQFELLTTAIGTNDLQKYFPFYTSAANQDKPNLYILNHLQRDASGKIKLGIDLQGGTSFLVEMNTNALLASSTNGAQSQVMSAALDQAVSVLRKRIDKFGVAEPVIQSQGDNRILIQLPGLSQADKESAKEQIQKSAFLEFRLVHDRSSQMVDLNTGQIREPIPPDYEVLKMPKVSASGKSSTEYYVVKKKAEDGLSGDIINSARLGYDNTGHPEIDFELKHDAALKFGDFTQKYSPEGNTYHLLSIVLDGHLYSAARIMGPILGGNVSISGSFTQDEARGLVNVLQNPLRAPLSIASSYDVGATLGKDSIQSGVRAAIYGVIFVCAFMLVYYWVAGIAANIALLTNVIIVLGVMCAAGSTFTLPGIAGAVLTVGMAVDANVLIYERIREELAKGKSLRGAIDAGYARAFGTIFDSHVTTLISSIILIWMGTGEIKGFGVTLTIGVAASLFTALIVTRLIFNFLVDRNLLKSLWMMHLIKSSKVNFMGIAKPLFIITWLFVIGSLAFGLTRGSKLLGVDFRGGDSTIYTFTQRVEQKDIRSGLEAIGLTDVQIQYQRDATGSGKETLRVTSPLNTSGKVETTLKQKFPQAHFEAGSQQQVGGAVGEEVQRSAVIASLCAMLGILIYVAFRYEFSFAVAAVVAVLHDVLFTIGAYCIANYVSGREFNATVVAAVLTIIGFSINDKIVIFDRIREDLKLGVRGSFKDIINQALNQTLSRTIITSGTVFLATLSLFIFGGGVINDFAFTFLIGIIIGTYSSIYIASVLVLWWHKGERPNLGTAPAPGANSVSAKV